jgi:beta-galactosidase
MRKNMNNISLKNWKFHYNDCPEAWYKGFIDELWTNVTVPHDWSVTMPFSKEYSSGTGYLAGGIGWYRTEFYLPESLKEKKIFITFDGVYKNSQVWCNSYYLGKRPFGYSTFQYDITDQVSFGDIPNIVAVRVDHKDIADSRWFTGSGITRKVTVSAEELVHPMFQGTFFKTPSVSSEEAEINISNTIINESNFDMEATIENKLIFEGKEIMRLVNTCHLSPKETTNVDNSGIILNPSLWSTDTPNLYELQTIITSKTKENCFTSTNISACKVGIRSIHFDSNKGFYLNGEPLKLKGVCVHHDAGCLGAAVLPEVWLRRLCTLKEMGCNAIRMSHNPHMPELYDLCDSLGFLVMDEAFDEWEGVKNKWSTGHNVYPPKHQGYFEDFPEWHERDLSDLIKRDRNHPSIIMWSIGNEIDYPNDPYCHPLFTSMTGNNDKNKPAAEMQFNQDKPNAERLSVIAKQLTKIVKQYDSSRPVTAAVAFPELSTHIGYIDSFDVVGYNYKEQFYADDHKRFPEKPFLGSENSHSVEAWKAVRDNEYISGQFLWTGIDYLGEAFGWPIHGSGAGNLTVAGYPKISYYRRQSFWSENMMIYLVTARATTENETEQVPTEWKHMYRSWNYMPGEMVEVRCYTNVLRAELFCNNKSFGIQQNDTDTGYISWIVPFEAGELSVKGYDHTNLNNDQLNSEIDSVSNPSNYLVSDIIKSTGTSCNIKLNLWDYTTHIKELFNENITSISSNITPMDTTTRLKQIEVTITDGNGNWVTNDNTMLMVTLSGPGKLLGLENGDLSDVTEYTASYRRAYEGRLLIYVAVTSDSADMNSKTTTLTVCGAGLKTAILEI